MSYKHKILTGFIVLVSMFEAIVIIYDINNAYQLRQTFLHQRSQLIIQTYSQALRIPSWNLDQDTSESILKSILLDPDIIKVQLSYQQNSLPDVEFSSLQNPQQNKDDFIIQQDIIEPDSNQIIASLSLFFSKQGLYQFLTTRKTEGFIEFLILLLINILLAYGLINWITSPLEKLSKAIRRLANNELNISIPVSSHNDEIDQVAHSVKILQQNNLELDELRHSMENKIREQVKDLVLAKEEAEAGALAKEQFLATMSHEIRTPMNGVLGMAQILNETSLDQEQQESVDIILQSGKDLIHIINEILDFSKLDANQIILEALSFNLKELIGDLVKLQNPSAKLKKLQLIVNYDKNCPEYFIGDPSRFKQILLNLFNNAIKFTSEGAVTIAVQYLHGGESTTQLPLEIKIIDTGIGISEDHKHKLFTPFTQADQSTTRKYGGTGLGLSISKKLLQLMGGEIKVNSQLEHGTTFILNLNFPVDQHQTDTRTPPQNEIIIENTPVSEHSVLLVEDNSVNQKIALIMLQKIGLHADLAVNGKQAVEQWKTHHHPFIFMDCLMPEMDGYQATQAIRELQKESSLKTAIVALTANATKEDIEKCMSAGMDDIVTKPFKKTDLINVFNKWNTNRGLDSNG
ncbi:MAG: response regulator [gamma proteobacterium symbiont of Taylorina sp.]|nr:response regulator [gamma proteobacterium symbiont of Taylorina sp.]